MSYIILFGIYIFLASCLLRHVVGTVLRFRNLRQHIIMEKRNYRFKQ